MSVNSRSKGARYEREVASYLDDNGFPARRGQQFAGGADSPDVVSAEFPFHIETKMVERLNLQDAFDQATRDSGGKKPPCVIHRKKHTQSLITMKLEDFIKLINKKSWTS
tara:strand:+ start:189 stop:518 length:330 start_codon:yes stop_codon:yes gene_type:complete